MVQAACGRADLRLGIDGQMAFGSFGSKDSNTELISSESEHVGLVGGVSLAKTRSALCLGVGFSVGKIRCDCTLSGVGCQ